MQYRGYTLDKFQIEAIQALNANQNVIVAAPTGAGKTLIAEYLIERCLSVGGRIIYTSPIKALSNQKFRDWSGLFGQQVGIVTGDVAVRPDAPLCIMTTEVFRNRIFDRPEAVQAVNYAIFDEVHYINDEARGTVWEESILFAPKPIRFLCLSATVPNVAELARWMERVRGTEVVVISETKRPVPLANHFFIPRYGVGTLETVATLKNASPQQRNQLLNAPDADVVQIVCERKQLPCLYFCHSRKRCEDQAFDYGLLDLVSPRSNALNTYDLLCADRGIGQDKSVVLLRESIAHGIAYHHAGLLPALKDVVERMFADGLIPLIFTTETFALGLNFPAHTVIFDRLEKFDGARHRYLKPHEYHQMAGRAGRRGLDTEGHVYACVDPFQMEVAVLAKITGAELEDIDSRLDPSYATLLNLIHGSRGANQHPERSAVPKLADDWVEHSFRYFQSLDQLQQLEQQLIAVAEGELLPVECIHDQPDLIEQYQALTEALAREKTQLKKKQREARRAKKTQEADALRTAVVELESQARQTEKARKALLCSDCPHRPECTRRSLVLKKATRTTNRLNLRREELAYLTKDEVARRTAFLESLGYIAEGQLTQKGLYASKLYGYEAQTTELLFDGHFDGLDDVQMNILAAAICFESRLDATYQTFDAGIDFAGLNRRMQRLAERQRAFGIDKPFALLDPALGSVVHAWSKGCEFSELSKYTSASEGDLIRGLRRTLNLLRQLDEALPKASPLQAKVQRGIARMKRGVVDAETELLMHLNEKRL